MSIVNEFLTLKIKTVHFRLSDRPVQYRIQLYLYTLYECAFMVILCQFDLGFILTQMVPMTHMTPEFKCLSLWSNSYDTFLSMELYRPVQSRIHPKPDRAPIRSTEYAVRIMPQNPASHQVIRTPPKYAGHSVRSVYRSRHQWSSQASASHIFKCQW